MGAVHEGKSREGSAFAALAALLLLVPIAVVAFVLVPRSAAGSAAAPAGPVTIRIRDVGGFKGFDGFITLPALRLTDGKLSGAGRAEGSRETLPHAAAADVDADTADGWARELRAAGVGTRTDWGFAGHSDEAAPPSRIDPGWSGTATY